LVAASWLHAKKKTRQTASEQATSTAVVAAVVLFFLLSAAIVAPGSKEKQGAARKLRLSSPTPYGHKSMTPAKYRGGLVEMYITVDCWQ